MRASLRPQKRDHASAANTPTHRKVVHLRRCAEALLKSATIQTTHDDDDGNDDDGDATTHFTNGDDCNTKRQKASSSSSSLVVVAAEISLKAIRTAREGDLPRRLIDRDNYCPRCGTPKMNNNNNRRNFGCRPAQEETTPMQTNATKTRCSCCEYSFERKKSKTKKKKKKKRKRKEQIG